MRLKLWKLWIVFILLIWAAGICTAEIINLTPGTDQISTAIAGASAGDVIELAAGVYWETNTINTLAGDLTIRGAASAEVIVYGPTAPASYSDLIHVYGNLWLENIIFVGADSCRNGIMNYFGGVANKGDEMTAVKNNIYISNCQFHMIGGAFPDEGCVFWGGKDLEDYEDGMFHPVDTIRVTDCFIYGGHEVEASEFDTTGYGWWLPGWEATTYKGINCEARSARYIEIRRSTLWMLTSDAIYVDGAFVNSSSDPGDGADIDYVHTITDHVTIYKTWGGDGIQYEWCNENQSMTNSLVYITGRFSFKAKRGDSDKVYVAYCMGDSSSLEDSFSVPGTTFYDQIVQGLGCWPNTNPEFNDPENGDFSLDPDWSDAIDGADPASPDGPNMGDPHWNDPSTFWPNKAECAALIAKARNQSPVCDPDVPVARTFRLDQNYPNPFNPSTTITFTIAGAGPVNLEIYNLLGQKIRTLIDGVMPVGEHAVVWDGLDDARRMVSGGIYIFKLTAGTSVQTKKMLLMK